MIYLLPITIAALAGIIFTPLVSGMAKRLKIFDHPGQRKIHQRPTPLLGGVGLFGAFAATTLLFWWQGFITYSAISNLQLGSILLAGLVIITGGILDDRFDLKPLQQIMFPLAAIILIVASGITITFVTNPFGGVIAFPFYLGSVMAFFWLLGMVYTTKLLDGLDGLVAGITTIGAIIIFMVSLFWDVPLSGTSMLALILAGSCLGFLVFNYHPAKIFLGEGGSIFCGFMLGVLAIISGSKIATALLVMGVPILDVAWVIIQRFWQKRPMAAGDNKHLHFRLLDIGFSHRQAVLFLYAVTALFGASALFLNTIGKIITLGVLVIFMTILIVMVLAHYHHKPNHAKRH